MLDSTRAEGPSAVKHEVKPHIARGTLLILYAIIILIDDDTMLTREKSDDIATHSFKSIIYVHALQLDIGHESRRNPIFRDWYNSIPYRYLNFSHKMKLKCTE